MQQAGNRTVNMRIFLYILSIYVFIAAGTVIHVISPQWLKNISKEGRDAEAIMYINYGDKLMVGKNFEKAIVQYEKAIEISPDIQEAYINLSIAFNYLGDLKTALKHAKSALRFTDKPLYATLNSMADIYAKNKQDEEAVKYYLKAAEVACFPIRPLQMAGELLNNLKKWDEALQTFDKAASFKFSIRNCYMGMLKRDQYLLSSPKAIVEIQSQLNRGIDNIDLSTFDEIAFEEALKKDGILAGIYNQYGYTYAMKGDLQLAIEYFRLALKLKPEFVNAKKNLDYALQKQSS
jgi:tetratricopeptide (TPR) repeat protein